MIDPCGAKAYARRNRYATDLLVDGAMRGACPGPSQYLVKLHSRIAKRFFHHDAPPGRHTQHRRRCRCRCRCRCLLPPYAIRNINSYCFIFNRSYRCVLSSYGATSVKSGVARASGAIRAAQPDRGCCYALRLRLRRRSLSSSIMRLFGMRLECAARLAELGCPHAGIRSTSVPDASVGTNVGTE